MGAEWKNHVFAEERSDDGQLRSGCPGHQAPHESGSVLKADTRDVLTENPASAPREAEEQAQSAAVTRLLIECLEARTSATKARWVVQLAEFSWPFGSVPADEDLAPFLRGPFLEASREVLGEWTATDILYELQTILHLPPEEPTPRKSTFRPTRRGQPKGTLTGGPSLIRQGAANHEGLEGRVKQLTQSPRSATESYLDLRHARIRKSRT